VFALRTTPPSACARDSFGDDMAATAMIDRLIHHAEILSLKGDSYRLRGRDLDARPVRPAG
jgi:DNA replication protein DnaC